MRIYLLTASAVILLTLQALAQGAPIELSFDKGDIVDDRVEIALNVNDFTDIFSFQINVLWDPTVLVIEDMTSIHASIESTVMVKPEDDLVNSDPGKLRLNFFDASGAGNSIPDGGTICVLVFKMVGSECATTDLSIDDIGPLPVEKIEIVSTSGSIGAKSETFEFQIPGPGCLTSGIQQGEVASVRIYPNPVRDNLQVSFNNHTPDKSALIIYTDDGKALTERPLTNTESNIDISSISNGVYFYEIRDKGIIVDYGKIMKI